MRFSSQFLRIAEVVLRRHGDLSARQIVDIALEEKMFDDGLRGGKTPHQTMKSKLSTHIRRSGALSVFVRTRPGRFGLRDLIPVQNVFETAPLKPPPPREQVLVFDSGVLDELGRFQGIKRSASYRRALLRRGAFTYMDRLEAEQDDRHKQVITYILVRNGPLLLSFRRGTYNRVEDFLRGSLCVGFGGHVTEADRNLFGLRDYAITESAIRELNEEVRLPSRDRETLLARRVLTPLGLLNDDSSPAGRRHIAFLFAYDVSDNPEWQRPTRGEKSVTQLRWFNPADAVSLARFEYWSQLCLLTFYRGVTPVSDFLVTRRRVLRPPHILCVLGPIGSGKTEATRVLRDDLGYTEINSGRVLARLLGIPPVPQTPRVTFQRKAAEFIKSTEGVEQLAREIINEAGRVESGRVLVDGIRHRATLDALRKIAAPLCVAALYVHTPPHVAYRFYIAREHASTTELEFFKMRESPAEGDVVELIRDADAVLYNWTGKLAYRKVIIDLLTSEGRR